MKKFLFALAAVFALSSAVPTLAAADDSGDSKKEEKKPAKKGGKKGVKK
jgi:ABC-type oligopeptide transport system substrate-binding subunit